MSARLAPLRRVFYLPASVGTFPEPDAFVATLERAGFTSVRAHRLSFGIVYLYRANRP
jgi:ubiquinone/menaquinone biosynthesis C-methylase UbiE